MNDRSQAALTNEGFETFLRDQTRSEIELTTIGSDWSKLQTMTVEQGDDAFQTPPLEHHFLAICTRGFAVADITFDDLMGSKRSIIEPKSLCFMPANNACQFEAMGRYNGAHILLNPTLMIELLAEQVQGDPSRVEIPGFVGAKHDFIQRTAMEIVDEAVGPQDALKADHLASRLGRLLIQHVCDLPQETGAKLDLTPLQFSRAIDYIEDNLATDFGLADMARHVGVDTVRLEQGFENEVGYSLSTFKTERRITLAQDLCALSSVKTSAEEIAARSGFPNAAALDGAFRAHLGISFENYRKGRLG